MEIHIFEVSSSFKKEEKEFVWSVENLKLEDELFFKKIVSETGHFISAWPLLYSPIEEVFLKMKEGIEHFECKTFSIFVESDEAEELAEVLESSMVVLLGQARVYCHIDGPYMMQFLTDSIDDHNKANARIRLESFCPVNYLDPRVMKDAYIGKKALGSN